MNYALSALHIIKVDALLLRKAIENNDPRKELLLRADDIQATAEKAIHTAEERSPARTVPCENDSPYFPSKVRG